MIRIPEPTKFEWDKGNTYKIRHNVQSTEAEQAFFDKNRKFESIVVRNTETRYILLGKTLENRLLYIVFIFRMEKIRVISARDVSKKRELEMYEKKLNVPKFYNEEEEATFWANLDISEYFESEAFTSVEFPNLKPTTKAVSIRLPEYLIDAIKAEANKKGVAYQTDLKDTLYNAYILRDK